MKASGVRQWQRRCEAAERRRSSARCADARAWLVDFKALVLIDEIDTSGGAAPNQLFDIVGNLVDQLREAGRAQVVAVAEHDDRAILLRIECNARIVAAAFSGVAEVVWLLMEKPRQRDFIARVRIRAELMIDRYPGGRITSGMPGSAFAAYFSGCRFASRWVSRSAAVDLSAPSPSRTPKSQVLARLKSES